MVLGVIGLTGATGMLGRHVRAELQRSGYHVRPVGRREVSSEGVACWDLVQWKSDDELDALFPDVQALVHAGALVPAHQVVDENYLYDVNVRACANLGLWALKRKIPAIFISGATVYADTLAQNIDEDAALGWGWGGHYGLSKLLAEDIWCRLRALGGEVAILRPSSIYGFGLPASKALSQFLQLAHEDGTICLSLPVDDRVNFVHAADVARALVAVLNQKAWGIFNVASGCPVSFLELAEACIDVAGAGRIHFGGERRDVARLPITRYDLNIQRAGSLLGWSPAIDIRTGLKMMLDSSTVI